MAWARDAEEGGAEGGNTAGGNPATMEECRPRQDAGRATGSCGASVRGEGLREGQELHEEEEEEGEGETAGEVAEADGLEEEEEEEEAGLLVGSLTAATSERRALSLDDLKDLFR